MDERFKTDISTTEKEHQQVPLPSETTYVGAMPIDSKLAVFKDRLTYTFILNREVSSIHFDRKRGEIFLRGHSIANMVLTDLQKKVLQQFKAVLEGDGRAKLFLSDYSATLAKCLADN